MDVNNRIKAIENRLTEIESEKDNLQQELNQLKKNLIKSEKTYYGKKIRETCLKTKNEKIKLFLSLFGCRQDVYPKFWENKGKGIKGYSPVCKNEWIGGICNKPKTKCSVCPNHLFLLLDRNVIKAHLEGKITIGTYTIKQDDTCIFLSADFDKQNWQEDVLAYKKSAEELNIPVYLERSKSGNGAHTWIFFSEELPAKKARELGALILSNAILNRHTISLDSYDRFFPNQDYLPKGGFGNLIALPLQREPRNSGNTVFINDELIPYNDQWDCLSNIYRLSLNDINELLSTYSNNHDITGINITEENDISDAEAHINIDSDNISGCYMNEVKIQISSKIMIDIKGLPSKLITALKRVATFANPKYFELQKLRFSTWKTPKYIFCGELENGQLMLPRGTLEKINEILIIAGSNISIIDHRLKKDLLNVVFNGELRGDQESAVKEILKYEFGVLVAPTGSGKTVIACDVISQRKVPTLILVHRKQLIEQWQMQINNLLSIPKKEIGIIGGGKKNPTGIIDIAMLQTLSKMEDLDMIVNNYEQIIIDECHHIPAISFESVLYRFPVRYCLGLTATPFRKDGHQPILYMQCGQIRYEIKDNESPDIVRRVIVKETSFRVPFELGIQPQIHEVWNLLVEDADRLELIANDIFSALKEKRLILVLSERKEHLENISNALDNRKTESIYQKFILTGDLGKKKRKQIFSDIQESINDEIPFCILSTGSLIGEGFDMPELDTLILAMPISFRGRIIQYAGRIHREHQKKQDIIIYDYLDPSSGLTISMFKKRVRAYKKMGYIIDGKNNPKIMKWIK